ncbi:hypothetical protein Pcinc_042091 [Petrolisthes cinctipes]|uniref:Neurotransmitter-gated ion-channel transmembrane domain-containing protein n=1 Tax=Petrolisthes cinctipes TaxID=88211 RepID=A0AAE1BLY5_PETCI|nr:hypothetical protein Pcinc_042091 [Petrolisthes cinctipes]
MYNVVLPCMMMSVLTLLVFCLPPDSGEKIALGVTVLLAFSVFMLAIAEKMPETSESIPLIGKVGLVGGWVSGWVGMGMSGGLGGCVGGWVAMGMSWGLGGCVGTGMGGWVGGYGDEWGVGWMCWYGDGWVGGYGD